MRRLLIVLVVMLCCASMRAVAQEAHPPQATDATRPTHGIIRKPQPKPPAEAAKPATSSETAKTEVGKTDAGKSPAPAHAKPASSTEAVAAAIANAVRSLEEKEKKKPESVRAQPPRATRHAAPPAVAQRRYSVKWPSQRFEVHWAAPVDRVEISWGPQD
jgi:hypothetical protein